MTAYNFSLSRYTAVSASYDKTLRLWSLAASVGRGAGARDLGVLAGHKAPALVLAWGGAAVGGGKACPKMLKACFNAFVNPHRVPDVILCSWLVISLPLVALLSFIQTCVFFFFSVLVWQCHPRDVLNLYIHFWPGPTHWAGVWRPGRGGDDVGRGGGERGRSAGRPPRPLHCTRVGNRPHRGDRRRGRQGWQI